MRKKNIYRLWWTTAVVCALASWFYEYSPKYLTDLFPVKDSITSILSYRTWDNLSDDASYKLLRVMSGDYSDTIFVHDLFALIESMEDEDICIPKWVELPTTIDEHTLKALYTIYTYLHPALRVSDTWPGYWRDGEWAKYNFLRHTIEIYRKCFLELEGIDDPEQFACLLSNMLIRRFLSECPHVYQLKHNNLYGMYISDLFRLVRWKYDSKELSVLYEKQGTAEYVAHHELEPLFQYRFICEYKKSAWIDWWISAEQERYWKENISNETYYKAGYWLTGWFYTPPLITQDKKTQSTHYIDYEQWKWYLTIASRMWHQWAKMRLEELCEPCDIHGSTNIFQTQSDLLELIEQ